MSHAFSILCPTCQDGTAVGTDAGFAATTVDVQVCVNCRAGGTFLNVTIRKSAAYQLADKLDRHDGLRHRDGLVVFGG